VSLLPSDTNNDPNYWGSKWYRPAALPPLDREFNVQKSKRDWEDKLDEMQVSFMRNIREFSQFSNIFLVHLSSFHAYYT
jgi:hypothetical protein